MILQMNQLAFFLDNVTISFGNEIILHHVNMKVKNGDCIVIIGPSGGGKTVLLKTMAGIFEPSSGHVYCEGEEWSHLQSEEKRILAKHIGVQFQKAALFDSLTVAENVAFPMREHTDWSEEFIQSKVDECLNSVGLIHVRESQPHELSGGMQLRLGIARALALSPHIVFYDDPTAGLDPINTDKMIDLIKNLKKKYQSTIIFVTHSVDVAFQMEGRIFLVAQQEVLETGNKEETMNSSDPRVQQFIHGKLKGPLTSR